MRHDMFVYFEIFVDSKTKEVNQQKNTNYLPAFHAKLKYYFLMILKKIIRWTLFVQR